ncbi:unnamed protein product [Cochlearia groenlandica]
MAEAENSEKPKLSLKLLVDKKKNKVVLAESGKDFVDILFSFLTLPMGTIVRLLEKYQKTQETQDVTIGCFNNLYKSVVDVGTDSFPTEPCKDMLLYPRNIVQYKELKLNVDDTGFLKYYRCTYVHKLPLCPRVYYSNFCSSRCSCGALMGEEFKKTTGVSEIFFSDKSLFSITDKMVVGFTSMGLALKILRDSGYTDTSQLQEILVDVDHDKVLALLHCLFSSDTPLTDVFLKNRSSCVITKQSLPLQGHAGTRQADKLITVSVFTRKLDNKCIYVESGKDFVDLLFTFLALPLKSAWEISGCNVMLGCIGNLNESFKSLISFDGRNIMTSKCRLPWYYTCQKTLLDVCYADREIGQELRPIFYHMSKSCHLIPIDPRHKESDGTSSWDGFVKKGEMFMVSDDLVITPMNLSVNICSLKKWNIDLDDIEEQVVNISQTDAISLLRASFMTSTALNTVFSSLLPKKPKEEKL